MEAHTRSRNPSCLQPGEKFQVAGEKMGADGVLYLKLTSGAGWAFDHKPGVGVMCRSHTQPSGRVYALRRQLPRSS